MRNYVVSLHDSPALAWHAPWCVHPTLCEQETATLARAAMAATTFATAAVCARWQHGAVAALRRHTEKCGGDVPPQAKLWRSHAAMASNHVAAWDRHSPAMQRWQTARVYIVAVLCCHKL